MKVEIKKVITNKKTIFKASVTSFVLEILLAVLLFMFTLNIFLSLGVLVITHPLFVYLTKKDPMFVDIIIGNINNPKELWF